MNQYTPLLAWMITDKLDLNAIIDSSLFYSQEKSMLTALKKMSTPSTIKSRNVRQLFFQWEQW